jgi:hypothetical protein
MNHADAPAATAAVLIRRPVAEVFELAGLKAWLEHRVALNLVWDRFPDTST